MRARARCWSRKQSSTPRMTRGSRSPTSVGWNSRAYPERCTCYGLTWCRKTPDRREGCHRTLPPCLGHSTNRHTWPSSAHLPHVQVGCPSVVDRTRQEGVDNGRFVTVLINTLKMPMEIGDGIAACVETVRRGLFDPLLLPATVALKATQGALGQPSFGTPPWGLPGEVKISLSMWDRQGGHRIPALEATDDLWDQALSALRAGAVE